MKISSLLLILALPLLVGCESLKRITDGTTTTPPEQAPFNPNDFVLSGTTTQDFQIIYTPSQGRTLTIEVLRPGQSTWVLLEPVDPPWNPYFQFMTGREGFRFGLRAEKDSKGIVHLWLDKPAAPTGTQYRIHNVKNI